MFERVSGANPGRLGVRLGLTTVVVVLAAQGSAGAATQIGENFVPNLSCGATGSTNIQSASPGDRYTVPAAGVLTSWSWQADIDATPPAIKLKVARAAGGNNFTIVGESALQVPTPSALSSFLTRVPVQAGDLLGVYVGGGSKSCAAGAAGYAHHAMTGTDVPAGTTAAFSPSMNAKFDVAAILEPDADNDGFGDETQDQCPGDDTAQGACPVPETTITKGPKDKTKKKTATFEFSSSIAGATFECSLDGAPFTPCSSPHEVKAKKGKHTLAVRASAKGQTDPSPASDDWKVKRKKK